MPYSRSQNRSQNRQRLSGFLALTGAVTTPYLTTWWVPSGHEMVAIDEFVPAAYSRHPRPDVEALKCVVNVRAAGFR